MEEKKEVPCRKEGQEKVSFDIKLRIVSEVKNGQISVNHAAKVYGISRSTIAYWLEKLSSFEQNSKGMSKNDELKKLKERIEELEFVKDFQQDIIANFEHVTGEHLSKKLLPEALANEIAKKRQNLSKRNG